MDDIIDLGPGHFERVTRKRKVAIAVINLFEKPS